MVGYIGGGNSWHIVASSDVRSLQDWKYELLIGSIHVDGKGLNDSEYRYWIRCGKFDVWTKLLTCLVGSMYRSCFLTRLL